MEYFIEYYDVISLMFNFLTIEEICNLMYLSKKCYQVLTNNCTYKEPIKILEKHYHPNFLKWLSKFKNNTLPVQKIIGNVMSISIDIKKRLSKCNLPYLKTLHLRYCRITDDLLPYLSNLTNLVELDLSSCKKITDNGFVYLSNLTNLKILSLNNCNITDTGLSYLSNLTNLQILNLGECYEITDDGLVYLSNLTNIQELCLRSCNITDAGLLYLSNLIDLNKLNLNLCERITDDGLVYLSNLKNLKMLDLTDCHNTTYTGAVDLKNVLHNLDILYMQLGRNIYST